LVQPVILLKPQIKETLMDSAAFLRAISAKHHEVPIVNLTVRSAEGKVFTLELPPHISPQIGYIMHQIRPATRQHEEEDVAACHKRPRKCVDVVIDAGTDRELDSITDCISAAFDNSRIPTFVDLGGAYRAAVLLDMPSVQSMLAKQLQKSVLGEVRISDRTMDILAMDIPDLTEAIVKGLSRGADPEGRSADLLIHTAGWMQKFLELPIGTAAALLSALAASSEDVVLLLATLWADSRGPGLTVADRQQLAGTVRVLHLTDASFFHVLPVLAWVQDPELLDVATMAYMSSARKSNSRYDTPALKTIPWNMMGARTAKDRRLEAKMFVPKPNTFILKKKMLSNLVESEENKKASGFIQPLARLQWYGFKLEVSLCARYDKNALTTMVSILPTFSTIADVEKEGSHPLGVFMLHNRASVKVSMKSSALVEPMASWTRCTRPYASSAIIEGDPLVHFGQLVQYGQYPAEAKVTTMQGWNHLYGNGKTLEFGVAFVVNAGKESAP
jgi:hypothetical protein